MEPTVLLLCLIYVLAIVYIANGKKHPKTNLRIFLTLAIGGIIVCLIHTACIYNKVEKTDFFLTLFAYIVFICVCFISYGVLLKDNTDKRKVANKEEVSSFSTKHDSYNQFEHSIELKPYNLNELKLYIDNDFQKLEKGKRDALKWSLGNIKKLSEKDQKTFINCAVCVMTDMELPHDITPVAKVEGLTQREICEICSMFRPFISNRTTHEDIEFVFKLFSNYFTDNDKNKTESISKKLIAPANFIVSHTSLFSKEEVELAKKKQIKRRRKDIKTL